jgi:hypothetical protein
MIRMAAPSQDLLIVLMEVRYHCPMPKKLDEEDRLSEMLTIVTTPGMRAHLDDAAERRELKNGYIVRQALREWLDRHDPQSQRTIDQLTTAYLARKTRKEATRP